MIVSFIARLSFALRIGADHSAKPSLPAYRETGAPNHPTDMGSKKRDAEAALNRIVSEMAAGTHVADQQSITVSEAAKIFLDDFQDLVRTGKRERSTFTRYEQHVRLFIESHKIASIRLSRLVAPDCVRFASSLETAGTEDQAIRALSTLKRILKFARRNGWIVVNPAEDVSIRVSGERTKANNKIEIPPKSQLHKLLQVAKHYDNTGKVHAFISLLLYGGLRMSELRGVRWSDLDSGAQRIHVRQRADRWQKIGSVKSAGGRRSIPLPPSTVNALLVWSKSAPYSELDLIFPTGAGNVESYANIYNRLWRPLMVKAEMTDCVKRRSKQILHRPNFSMHVLRHAAVSLWIEQGASQKQVMTWAGHARIQFTMDVYGHLWDDPEKDAAIALAIEQSIAQAI